MGMFSYSECMSKVGCLDKPELAENLAKIGHGSNELALDFAQNGLAPR